MTDKKPRVDCCLIGAAGSQKTEIAEAFQAASAPWFADKGLAPLRIADTNHEIIEKQGRSPGVLGDHYFTLQNYFNRVRVEDLIRLQGDSVLSVGTVIDAMAHLNARLRYLSRQLQTPDTEALVERELIVGQLFQSYFMDGRWLCNFAWYTPLPEKVFVPGQPESTYDGEVDAVIRDINLKFRLGVPILQGTVEQKVATMLANMDENFIGNPDEVEHVEFKVAAGPPDTI